MTQVGIGVYIVLAKIFKGPTAPFLFGEHNKKKRLNDKGEVKIAP